MTTDIQPAASFFRKLKKISKPLLPSFIIFVSALLIRLAAAASNRFADFFTLMISHYFRKLLAEFSSIFPFSLTETAMIILLPTIVIIFIHAAIINIPTSKLISVSALTLSIVFAAHTVILGVSYSCTPLADRLGIDASNTDTEMLKNSADFLLDELNTLADKVNFEYGSGSMSGMTPDELSAELVKTFDQCELNYGFIRNFNSRVKPFVFSNAFAALRISGLYCFYTGEANIVTTFPDFTIAYSAAHEMAHQRGFAREDEANFIAFLACRRSESAYLRYSADLNMLQYLINALVDTDPDYCASLISNLDLRIRFELASYGKIYSTHSSGIAGDVMSYVNDKTLKSQGVKSGEKSYSEVVRLAAAYFSTVSEK